jgi:hypothetical protein
MAAGTYFPPLQASWIWRAQPAYDGYNDTVVARKTVDLPVLDEAVLRITADTYYRLSINGQWVNDGPARSWPDAFMYDVIDVAPYLKAGENEIRIIAKYYGVGTFHKIPQQAGLLAQLDGVTADGEAVQVVSDASWEVARAEAWLMNTPKKSIQMGPFETYDARREDAFEFTPAAVLYATEGGPWKNLQPRDCPLLTKKPFALRAFVGANVLNDKWHCVAFPTARLMYPGLIEANNHTSMASAMATVIEVAEPMTLYVESPGSTVTIDGEEAKDGAFELEAGEHFLFMAVTSYFGHWEKDTELRFLETEGFTFKHPVDGNTDTPWVFVPFDEARYVNSDWEFSLLSAAEKMRVEGGIRKTIQGYLKDVTSSEALVKTFGDKIRTLSDEDGVMADPHWQFRAREVTGDGTPFVENPVGVLQADGAATITPPEDGDIELIYDLGEQNVGYARFVLDAAAGTIVDLSEVEYMKPDGQVQHTGTYRNTMRYICKEGRNEFTSLERRSGRYVFFILRNLTGPVTLHHLELIESTYPVDPIGYFTSSDSRLDQIWEISARTLKLCMEDTYTDCPLYEQTHWVGDARNEGVFGFTAFGAGDLARRCVKLTAQSIGEYPIALCQTPSCWETLLPAWSFLWGISVWDYYEYSGDTAFVEEIWPQVMANLHGAREFSDELGLFSGPFWNMFDWSGIDDGHSTVLHNSMLAVGAIDSALKCAEVLGKTDDAEWLQAYRDQLVSALNKLYDADRKAYPDSVHGNGEISKSTSMHTSFLSLLYDIAPQEWQDALLQNVLTPPEGMVQVGAPFASMYLLEALEKMGQQEAIMAEIYKNFTPMIEAGATTVWESYPTGTTGTDDWPTRSHTHAWSSVPIHFLNRIVLGIVPSGAAGEAFTISPYPSGLTWAKGATASLHGAVEVEWKLEGETLNITATGPEQAKLGFETNESLQGLKVTFNGKAM